MIIPKVKNLVESDFSDFTGIATVNKTFPIHIFKGGRNLLLDSKGTIDLTTLTWEPFEYETWEEIGEWYEETRY